MTYKATGSGRTATKPSPAPLQSIRQVAAPSICRCRNAIGGRHVVFTRDILLSQRSSELLKCFKFVFNCKHRCLCSQTGFFSQKYGDEFSQNSRRQLALKQSIVLRLYSEVIQLEFQGGICCDPMSVCLSVCPVF